MASPAAAGRAGVHGDPGLGAVVLGHGQRDALQRGQRQLAVAQLGAEPGVGAQRRRRTGQHAQEVRQLSARGQGTAEHRHRALRRGQVIVDLESAH